MAGAGQTGVRQVERIEAHVGHMIGMQRKKERDQLLRQQTRDLAIQNMRRLMEQHTIVSADEDTHT